VRIHPAELHIVVAPEPPPPPVPPLPRTALSQVVRPRWSVDDALVALDAETPPSHPNGDENVFAPPRVARAGPAAPAAPPKLLVASTRPSESPPALADLAAELHTLLPLLRTIVSGETPSWRRDAFFHGHGRARTRLRDPSSLAGLSTAEAEAVLCLLLDWFVGEAGADRARTVALVTDVLVPEAIARLVATRQAMARTSLN
jgi:hypothetical protein